MRKQYQGNGKLFDSNGYFISDTRYQIDYDSESTKVNSGTLFEIEYTLLIDIQDKECLLHLKDSIPVIIHTTWIRYPPAPYQLDFVVHSEIRQ